MAVVEEAGEGADLVLGELLVALVDDQVLLAEGARGGRLLGEDDGQRDHQEGDGRQAHLATRRSSSARC